MYLLITSEKQFNDVLKSSLKSEYNEAIHHNQRNQTKLFNSYHESGDVLKKDQGNVTLST